MGFDGDVSIAIDSNEAVFSNVLALRQRSRLCRSYKSLTAFDADVRSARECKPYRPFVLRILFSLLEATVC